MAPRGGDAPRDCPTWPLPAAVPTPEGTSSLVWCEGDSAACFLFSGAGVRLAGQLHQPRAWQVCRRPLRPWVCIHDALISRGVRSSLPPGGVWSTAWPWPPAPRAGAPTPCLCSGSRAVWRRGTLQLRRVPGLRPVFGHSLLLLHHPPCVLCCVGPGLPRCGALCFPCARSRGCCVCTAVAGTCLSN